MLRAALVLLLACLTAACAKHEYRLAQSPAPQPVTIAPANSYTERDTRTREPNDAPEKAKTNDINLSGPLAGAPAARSAPGGITGEIVAAQRATESAFGIGGDAAGNAPPTTTPPAPIEVGGKEQSSAEMIDIEARLEIEVEAIDKALVRIRSFVAQAGGQVVNEVVESRPGSAGASLSLRVPTPRLEQFLAGIGASGKLLSRKIESKDIGREYHDAGILLRNLEATLRRYEELLSKAQGTPQVIEIEKELSRVRTQLDRVKGDMQWMRDRASRATIYVTLSAPRSDDDLVKPTAHFYPGLRGTSIFDLSAKGSSRTFVGGGVSARFAREFSFDADWLTRARNGDGVDLFIATAGTELYSDLLGGGRRRYFNPYLGFRAGYVNVMGDGGFAPGGVLGVELIKTESVILELDFRGFGFIGIEDTTHAAIQTSLGLNFAY